MSLRKVLLKRIHDHFELEKVLSSEVLLSFFVLTSSQYDKQTQFTAMATRLIYTPFRTALEMEEIV